MASQHGAPPVFNNKVIAWIDHRLPIFSYIEKEYHTFPTPRNFNYFWNFGAIATVMLVLMIATGIVLVSLVGLPPLAGFVSKFLVFSSIVEAITASSFACSSAFSAARERGCAVLFTEHDMDIVFELADRVLAMDKGRLIATGAPAEVRADPVVRAVYLGEA